MIHIIHKKEKISDKEMLFSNEALRKLIIPLVIEQFLAVAMGMADTIMVTSCGESAVSGISLVDTVCILMIGLFSAMSSGGAVVVAQYMGKQDKEMVGKASNQLFLSVGGLSLLFMVLCLLGRQAILSFLYRDIETAVMTAAETYFFYAALSFPFLAIYNGGAALFRAIGNSKISMKISLVSNILNVAGNAILIYGCNMGVAGAAIATLISRMVAAIGIVLILLRSSELSLGKSWRLDFGIMRKILYIGIPNGLENSIFQLGKLLLSSLIASFGTVAITANAVVGSVGTFQLIPQHAMGIALITVIGQCIGAKEVEQAKYYLKKMLLLTHMWMAVIGVILAVFVRPLCGLYHLSETTETLAIQLLLYNCVASTIANPPAFTLPNALRAANDVKFTMVVSITSMWLYRILLAYILADFCGMGLWGVWLAMSTDWIVRSVFFVNRVRNGKWLKHMDKITKEN